MKGTGASVLLLLAAACPGRALPVTITWSAQNAGGALGLAAGGELPAGCLVRLGAFSLTSDEVRALSWNPPALEAHFTEVARTAVGRFDDAAYAVTGAFAATAEMNSAELPEALQDRPLCIWVCNAATVAGSSQHGIFSRPEWTLAPGLFGALAWDLSEVAQEDIIVGGLGPELSATLGGPLRKLASVQALADHTDADLDGAPGLVEEAFGMNPLAADAESLPQAVVMEQNGVAFPALKFRRRSGGIVIDAATYEAGGLRYVVETSVDLLHWSAGLAVVAGTHAEDSGAGWEMVTVRITQDAPARYFRVTIQRL